MVCYKIRLYLFENNGGEEKEFISLKSFWSSFSLWDPTGKRKRFRISWHSRPSQTIYPPSNRKGCQIRDCHCIMLLRMNLSWSKPILQSIITTMEPWDRKYLIFSNISPFQVQITCFKDQGKYFHLWYLNLPPLFWTKFEVAARNFTKES